jgi:hypothetical protein
MDPQTTAAQPPAGPAATPRTFGLAARALKGWLAPIGVGMLTLMLTVLLAFESSELHSADLALREYQDLVNERPQDKLYQAWKMFRFEHVLKVSGPPLTQLDEYQKLVDAARELGDKRGAIQQLLLDASVLHILPPGFASDAGLGWLRGDVVSSALAGPGAASSPAAGGGSSGASQRSDYAFDDDVCADGPASVAASVSAPVPAPVRAAASKPAVVPSPSELSAHMRGFECFLKVLKITPSDFSYPLWSAIYATRDKVNLLVSWLLPGLYGLLGACVHLMRSMLPADAATSGRAAPTPAGLVRPVPLLSILLRCALGGLSGIIVGWFWVPGSTPGVGSGISISSVPFGIAFLAGFGIEGLFGMLDRLLKNLALGDASPGDKGEPRKLASGA